MAKQIIFGEEARHALKRGIDTLTEAVKVTLGPKGHAVALDKKWGAPVLELRSIISTVSPVRSVEPSALYNVSVAGTKSLVR